MTTILAYALIGTFLVVERWLRKDAAARSLEADVADRGTTTLIGAAFSLALSGGLVVAVLRRRSASGRTATRWLGLATMLGGLLLRVWAARALGRYYTRTLRVAPDQPVVRSGPYRVVRHPGYLADIVLWMGFGVALGSWLLTVAIAASMAVAYGRRIAAEEALLVERLGDAYRDYRRVTWRLLPPVY